MDFLKFFSKKDKHDSKSAKQNSRKCPNLEHIMDKYWCDIGSERIEIAMLSFSYADIGNDHLKKYCNGNYRKCLLFKVKIF